MARKKTFSTSHLHISGLQVEVLRKNVKNLNLRVYPAEQQIRISVPRQIPEKKVVQFIHQKLPWIKKHLSKYKKKKDPRTFKIYLRRKTPLSGKGI